MKNEKNASFLADHQLGIFHSQKQVQPEPRKGKNIRKNSIGEDGTRDPPHSLPSLHIQGYPQRMRL